MSLSIVNQIVYFFLIVVWCMCLSVAVSHCRSVGVGEILLVFAVTLNGLLAASFLPTSALMVDDVVHCGGGIIGDGGVPDVVGVCGGGVGTCITVAPRVWCPSMAGGSNIIGVGGGDGAGVAHSEETFADSGLGGVGAGAAHKFLVPWYWCKEVLLFYIVVGFGHCCAIVLCSCLCVGHSLFRFCVLTSRPDACAGVVLAFVALAITLCTSRVRFKKLSDLRLNCVPSFFTLCADRR